jgi:hypothetical protein
LHAQQQRPPFGEVFSLLWPTQGGRSRAGRSPKLTIRAHALPHGGGPGNPCRVTLVIAVFVASINFVWW